MTKIKVNNEDKAKCNFCKKELSANSSSGTHHLHEHLKRCPRKRVAVSGQKILSEDCFKPGQLTTYAFNQEDSRRHLVDMVLLHEYPLSIVDHVTFRRYTNSLQPSFKIPTRNTLRSDILKAYETEKKNIKCLGEIEGRVAITTDMWTSNNQRKGYMAVTTHFIDSSWILQSQIIGFSYVPSPPTSEVLADKLIEYLIDWNLDGKISTTTLDNCTTNDAMIHIIKDKLEPNTLIKNGEFLHTRCCAHVLNIIVKYGMEVMKKGIERIQDNVVYWGGTPNRVEKFEETTKQLCIQVNKKLSYDCPTRWNSTFLMLETALLYKDVFPRLKLRDAQYDSVPSDEDWKLAKQVCEKLRLFHKVTEIFLGTKYPTSNQYFPKVCDIKSAILDWCNSEVEIIKKMALNMLSKFDKYWNAINEIIVLDPRYKMTLFDYYYPKLYGSQASNEKLKIRRLLGDLVFEYQLRNASESNQQALTTPSLNDAMELSVALSEMDLFVLRTQQTQVTFAKNELEYYLEEGILPVTKDFDILLWWKINRMKFLTLRMVARDILAIPISTIASESAFSTGGRIVTPNRNRLNENLLEALMCGQNWLWVNEKKEGEKLVMDEFATIQHVDNDDDSS